MNGAIPKQINRGPDGKAEDVWALPNDEEFLLDRDDLPNTWGLRMFNGKDEPQITVFFPNPYVTKDDEVTNAADWSRIEVWEELLPRYTGNAPDGLDRQSQGFARY